MCAIGYRQYSLGTSLNLLLLLWKVRITFEGKGRQGGDGGACKLLGCLLGDVIEVLEVLEVLVNQQSHLAEFPQIDFGLAVPVFKQRDDPFDAINKMIQQAATHDERVTIQPVQGRQSSFTAGTSETRANISGTEGNNSGQQRNYNFWQTLEVAEGPAYQADDLDAYDSDCDEISIAKAVLMANLSIVQDTNSSAQQDAMILSMFEQLSIQVTNCNKVNKDNLITNESLSAKLKRYKERVELLEERQNVELSTRENLIMDDIIREKNAQFADFEKEINSLKQTLSEQLKEKELLTETFNVLKNESKEKENKNIDKEIALEKKVTELDNIVY
ncbi:hypothetical protein Tco_0071915 [Tanacetum coccineum]